MQHQKTILANTRKSFYHCVEEITLGNDVKILVGGPFLDSYIYYDHMNVARSIGPYYTYILLVNSRHYNIWPYKVYIEKNYSSTVTPVT